MNPMRFIICRTASGWHVRFIDSRNHKIILWSENYERLADAQNAVKLAHLWAGTAPLARIIDLRKTA